ncbi:hypothetical protein U1Q18_010461, partial [Sarracenia purpurea var. burkii]
ESLRGGERKAKSGDSQLQPQGSVWCFWLEKTKTDSVKAPGNQEEKNLILGNIPMLGRRFQQNFRGDFATARRSDFGGDELSQGPSPISGDRICVEAPSSTAAAPTS